MNLKDLQTPKIIEELSVEEILQRMKEALVAMNQEYTAYLESDPLIKLLEVCAYRELLLRQRINQSASSNLLAFATGSDLDNLGALYGIARKDGETDDEFRERIRLKIVGWSTAGPKEAYISHAMNADARVKEANADSPEPGRVRISILSKEDGGVASEDLIRAVDTYIQRDDIKVLTDTVTVVSAVMIPMNVVANIQLLYSTPPELLDTIRSSFIVDFHKIAGLGISIPRSWIISHLFVNGVENVDLISPAEDVIADGISCVHLAGVNLTRI
jgi:phage-related baseplate assembly protein